jgi:hypothetical protein
MNARIDLPTWLTGASSADDVQAYIDHGWVLVPIPPSSKAPKAHGWNQRAGALKSSADLLEGWGIGLAHAYSGTCALDIDSLGPATSMLTEHGIDLHALLDASDAVQIVSGREGRAKLLYRLSEPLPSKKIANGTTTIFELRCATSNELTVQDVCPPSQHPQTGLPYRWAGRGHWSRLPVIPQALLDLWRSMLATESAITSTASTDATWTEITGALEYISPDCSRDEWITVGMALHSHGAQCNQIDHAFTVWNTWSERSTTKYPGPRDMAQQWHSFRAGKATAVTMGSVFKMARDSGWTRPQVDASGLFGPTGGRDDWPEPMPLPTLPAVPAFDLAWLPDAIRRHVADVAQRMQCPPDMPAVGALGALSAVIGRREFIMPKAHDTWTVFPNLWGMVVAPPGWKKSPALAAMLAPLHSLERDANREHEAALADWVMAKERIALSNSAAKSAGMQALKKNPAAEVTGLQAEPAEPVPRRYVVNNFSLEALVEVMIGNPNGVLAFGDELHGLLKMADKPGNEELHSFLLMGWNGDDSFTLDRIVRGRRYVDHVCLSILGGIQPGRLQEYLTEGGSGGAIGSGFMNRFQLVTWPDLPDDYTYIDRAPDLAAQDAYQRVFHRLAGGQEFPNLTVAGDVHVEGGARHFDLEAQAVFQDWHEQIDRLCRSDTLPQVMISHLSKYPSLVASLALILAVADDVRGDVPVRHLNQAIQLAEYFRAHAERVFSCTTRPDTAHAHALLAKIRAGAVDDGFTARDIYRNEWSMLNREGTEKAIALLCDFDHLERMEPAQSGRGRPQGATYRINPKSRG